MTGTGPPTRTVVIVEGASDQAAVLAVAARLGRDLSAERILVAATGGATNIARHLELLGPRGRGVRLAGLYDAAEERFVHGGLRRAGLGRGATRTDLEGLGFFACVDDLEEELIRALGVDAVLGVIERHRDLSRVPHPPAPARAPRTDRRPAPPPLPRHHQRPQGRVRRPAGGRRAGRRRPPPARLRRLLSRWLL